MKKILRITAILAVLTLFTTSCVTIRQFSFSKTNLDISADDITSMRLRIKPDSSNTSIEGYLFVLTGIDEELDNLNRKEWQDIDGDWGMAPAAVEDATLRNRLLEDGKCALPGGSDADDIESSYNAWRAYRTNIEVDLDNVDATSRLNFVHNLGIDPGSADPNDVGQILAITGMWIDDGDGVPESADDSYLCNSAIFTSVTFKS